MGIAVIFFSGAEPFGQIVNIPSTEGLMRNLVKIDRAVSEEETFKDYIILYMFIAPPPPLPYTHTTPGDKMLIVIKMLCFFNHTAISL